MRKPNGNRPNALKHGAFAKTAVLPWEDPEQFEELHSSLIEEWAPVGPTEQDAVFSIAMGMWRKRRLAHFVIPRGKDVSLILIMQLITKHTRFVYFPV